MSWRRWTILAPSRMRSSASSPRFAICWGRRRRISIRTNTYIAMYVLVRIEMRRRLPQQMAKRGELALDLILDGARIVHRRHDIQRKPVALTITPFRQIDVQTDAQLRVC